MREDYKEILHSHTDISTKRLLLRKFTLDDIQDIYTYASDEQTLKNLAWTGIKSLEEAKELIDGFYSNDGVYAISLKDTGRCIGCICLNVIPEHEKADFGYVLNIKYWNQGYMTEALNSVIMFCFQELELNRVEAFHYVGNEGSGKVMENCSMRKEGYAIQEVKIKGVFRDVVHYGITKEKWFRES